MIDLRVGLCGVLIVFVVSGCGFLKPRGTQNTNVFPVRTGRVLDAKFDVRGAKILIVPFTAGPGVESTKDLERISLMIVKGIAQTFQESELAPDIVTSKNQSEADFIVQGHVTNYRVPSKMDRLMHKNRGNAVWVEGKLVRAGSKQAVLVFEDRQQAKVQSADGKALGLLIGENIGKFILTGAANPGVQKDAK